MAGYDVNSGWLTTGGATALMLKKAGKESTRVSNFGSSLFVNPGEGGEATIKVKHSNTNDRGKINAYARRNIPKKC
jgi:hypothetical protein